MTTCASCGKEMRDDDWTCGTCGAPAGGGAASNGTGPSGYGSGYQSQPTAYADSATYSAPVAYGAPLATVAPRRGMSRSTITIIVVAALAIIAIVAVWFVFVRGTGGSSPYLGTWKPAAGNDASVTIKLRSGEFTVTMIGTDASGAEEKYTIPAHLAGADLEITVDDFAEASGDDEKAAQAKAVFEAMIPDFKLVFALQNPTHLQMTVEGAVLGNSIPADDPRRSTVLVKAQ